MEQDGEDRGRTGQSSPQTDQRDTDQHQHLHPHLYPVCDARHGATRERHRDRTAYQQGLAETTKWSNDGAERNQRGPMRTWPSSPSCSRTTGSVVPSAGSRPGARPRACPEAIPERLERSGLVAQDPLVEQQRDRARTVRAEGIAHLFGSFLQLAAGDRSPRRRADSHRAASRPRCRSRSSPIGSSSDTSRESSAALHVPHVLLRHAEVRASSRGPTS